MVEKNPLMQLWYMRPLAKLLETFRMAVAPSRMVIAMAAVILISLTGCIIDIISVQTVDNPVNHRILSVGTSARVYACNPLETIDALEKYYQSDGGKGVFSTLWSFSAARFNAATISVMRFDIVGMLANIWLFIIALGWAVRYHSICSLSFIIISAAITCVAGGAICRSCALEFARGEKPGLGESLRFGLKNFKGFAAGPTIVICIIGVICLINVAFGFMGNIPWAGEIVLAVLLPISLVVGAFLVVVLIGTISSAGLMLPVVAYEMSDGYDAISRSFRYVFTQPWWMLFYTAVGIVYGTLSYLTVRFFAFLILIVTYLLLSAGIFTQVDNGDKLSALWPQPEFFNLTGQESLVNLSLTEGFAAMIIQLIVLAVIGLIVAFLMNFYFCVNTITYSLIRHNADGTCMDQIVTHLRQFDAGS